MHFEIANIIYLSIIYIIVNIVTTTVIIIYAIVLVISTFTVVAYEFISSHTINIS